MKTKNLMVFFLTLASILLVANMASATSELVSYTDVKVNDMYLQGEGDVSVIAGETIDVQVFFRSLETASDVKFKAEIEGKKVDVQAVSPLFNVEEGQRYSKRLSLTVPSELQEAASDDFTLDLKVYNNDFRSEHYPISLRVQRPSYDAKIMSIEGSQSIQAGNVYPVNVVLKNTGYNKLDDLYVTAKIEELGIERTAYFGDLQPIDKDREKDTETRRIYLEIPFGVKSGSYNLVTEVSNEDFSVSDTKQIVVENDFSNNVFVEDVKKSVGVNDQVTFKVTIANPTDSLKVYRVVTESSAPESLLTSPGSMLVSVPAGLTKDVTVAAKPLTEGNYQFDVVLFSGEDVVGGKTLEVYADGNGSTNSAVALTIILGIILLVLIGVLVILLRKKPKKTEEFGESYY